MSKKNGLVSLVIVSAEKLPVKFKHIIKQRKANKYGTP